MIAMVIVVQFPAEAANTVKITPYGFDLIEGDDLGDVSNFGPFRQQQLYPAAEFASLPAGDWAITGFYLRPDKTVTSPSSATYADLAVQMSTTTLDEVGASFSANHGADVTTVFQGALTISTDALGPPEGPRVFDYLFPLDTPYIYDPSAGNLLVEASSHSGPAGSLIIDVFTDTSRRFVAAASDTASVGNTRYVGDVNQFEFVQVSPADFNLDLNVDNADLAIWQCGFGSPGSRENGDANGDGVVTGEDFLMWQREYVAGVPGLAVELGVPEPATWFLGCVGLAVIGVVRRSE